MPETCLTLCLNLRTGSVTQYGNYNFNSFIQVGNRVFGLNDAGLYSLDDNDYDDTAQIPAFFKGPLTDFGSHFKKSWMKAYLGYQSKGNLALTLSGDQHHWQTITFGTGFGEGHEQGALQPVERTKARYWQAAIGNTNGCDFAVDSLKLQGQNGKPVLFFDKITGLNTRVNPVRITYGIKGAKAVCDLAEVLNCDIDDTGRISRRKGFTLQLAGSFHSGVSDGWTAYGILEGIGSGSLVKINYDGSITTVATGLTPNLPMNGAFAGGQFYWQNSMQQGVVSASTANYPWVAIQPTASEIASAARQFYSPPLTAGPMCSFEGRIFMVNQNVVWFTEWLSYNRVRLSVNFLQFATPIPIFIPVKEGIWASDAHNIYFLRYEKAGPYPVFNRIQVAAYPAIAGTGALAEPGQILDGTLGNDPIALFSTTHGICIGSGQGLFKNLTEEKIIFPYSMTGAGTVINRANAPGMPIRYIVSLQP